MKKVDVHIEICREDAKLPEYANPGDAGMDIYAAKEVLIKPGQTCIVPTGLKMAIPEGYEMQIRPRSGISFKTPLRLSNSPGTIDSGYRDELGIIMTNTSCNKIDDNNQLTIDTKGNINGSYVIKKGDRIAQMVLQEVPRINFQVVDSVECIGVDRGGGFGSTGV